MRRFWHIAHLRKLALSAALFVTYTVPAWAHAQPMPAQAQLLTQAVGGVASVAEYVVLKPIIMFILTFSGWILGIAGVFFNWVVIKTVFQFGTFFGTSAGMLTAWGVIRDIANIGLLFGFIFMGVMLILNVDGGGHGHGGGMSAKKAIPRLIIFAVLLNFSLFASQAVIDISNAFASSFTTLAGENCVEAVLNSECANIGIAGRVMEMAGMGSIWQEGFLKGMGTDVVVLLGLSLFVIITAMVLIAAGIMLVARVVILSLLMVTSPIGFAGMVIPGLHGVAEKWWHMLISQSFFAPVMLLLIFVSLKLSETLNPNGDPLAKAFTGEANSVAGDMQVIVVFAIVIGFMIASLVAASKMGAMGAKFATSSAASLTVGGAAFVGRRSAGVVSSKIARGIRSSRIGSTETGRLFAGMADYGAKASYDLRATKAVGAIKGIDLGKPQKGGYDAIVHHAAEEREKYAKSLEQTKEDKAAEEKLKETKTNLVSEKKELGTRKAGAKKVADDERLPIQTQIEALEKSQRSAAQTRSDDRKIQEMKYSAALAGKDSVLRQEEEKALYDLAAKHREESQKEAQEVEDLKARITLIDTDYKNAVAEIEQRSKEIDAEAANIDLQIKGKAEDGKVIITGVGSNAAGYRYAQDLHTKRITNVLSAGGEASHHAAATIIKNANKTKLEKALDGIKEATEKTEHEKETDHVVDDHSGGTKAGAPAH